LCSPKIRGDEVGQKVHPIGFRLGITKNWNSTWFADKKYADLLQEDLKIRSFIRKYLHHAGIPKIEIKRASNRVAIIIHAARPGIVIGRKGAEVEKLRKDLQKITDKQISIDIVEVKKAEADAQLVAENVVGQIEKRIGFRRAMRRSVSSAIKAGAKGVKVLCSGRLDGAEISRAEWMRQGRVPLHTIRADIDYGFAEAYTTYGRVGVKAWIFNGEILPESKEKTKDNDGERKP